MSSVRVVCRLADRLVVVPPVMAMPGAASRAAVCRRLGWWEMAVLPVRIELTTFPLPRECISRKGSGFPAPVAGCCRNVS